MESTVSISFFLKHLRIKHGHERLYEMAKKLEVSTAYLSTVETGKRQPSDAFIERLEHVYKLTPQEVVELKMMRDFHSTHWRVDASRYTREQQLILLHLIHNIESLSEAKQKTIKKLLNL